MPSIVVAGDVLIDWYAYEVEAVTGSDSYQNWHLQPGTKMVAAPGGALLLAQLIEQATSERVSTHRLEDLHNIPPQDVIHSIADLNRFGGKNRNIPWFFRPTTGSS